MRSAGPGLQAAFGVLVLRAACCIFPLTISNIFDDFEKIGKIAISLRRRRTSLTRLDRGRSVTGAALQFS